ncbi:MAG: hypothetical protein ACI8W8_001006 [Rhodothermales bacterium]|jgi:hypothetical protein
MSADSLGLGSKTIVTDPREGRQPPAGPEGGRKQAALLVLEQNSVSPHTISTDSCIANVGTDPQECDVVLSDGSISKKQLVVMNVGMHWMFVDCGLKDLSWFDGVKRRQQYVPLDYHGVVRAGTTYMVFLGASGGYSSAETVSVKSDLDDDTELEEIGAITVSGFGLSKRSLRHAILIGSHDGCDLKVPVATARPFYAFAFWHPDGAFVEPLGNHSIIIDGKETSERHALTGDGCTLAVGGQDVTITIEGNPKEHAQQVFPGGGAKYENFALTALSESIDDSFYLPGFGRPVTIGRSASCDISLNDMAVSREHAQIVPAGKTLNLIDNFSANGTYVNGVKITKARVRAGDIIEIGDNFFLVHYT